MKPIGKYIVITKIEEEVKTESGILVDTIKENDLIYYDKAAGHSMLINDFVYTVISERDVVVVI